MLKILRGGRKNFRYTNIHRSKVNIMLFAPPADTGVLIPAVIQANDYVTHDNLMEVLKAEKESVRERLTEVGAIHFKGFRHSLDSFGPFMETLFWDRKPFYPMQPGIFSGTRESMARDVVEATYLNKRLPMAMHNEFSYLSAFPSFIGFRRLKAPTTGGETDQTPLFIPDLGFSFHRS